MQCFVEPLLENVRTFLLSPKVNINELHGAFKIKQSPIPQFSIHEDIRYVAPLALENCILFIQLLVCLRNLQRRNERLRSTANHTLLTLISIHKIDIFNARTDVNLAFNQFISLPYVGKKTMETEKGVLFIQALFFEYIRFEIVKSL